jgi:acetolactate synthase-1/2/3 large subunit
MTDTHAGPVHLSLPQDVLLAEIGVGWSARDALTQDPRGLSLPMAERALARIAGRAGRPAPARLAILAGAGLLRGDAAPRLAEIAERWHIPIATTLQAKGALPEGHPLSLGVFGYAGTRHATDALLHGGLELLLVLGSSLNERDSMHWALYDVQGLDIIGVNIAASTIATQPHVMGVVADARAFIDYMVASAQVLDDALAPARKDREAWLSALKVNPRLYRPEDCDSNAIPIHPARVVRELRDALPADGFVLIDSGAHRAFAGHYWRAEVAGTYVSATNLGPMGWAIPAAVGVQCAQPKRRVAVVTGDGCMQMHGLEVQTAARYALPIVYVVVNNSALGNVWLRAHQRGPVPAELTTVRDHDWAGFARALGAQGYTVRDPAELGPTLSSAFASGETCVVDIKCDKTIATPVGDFSAAKAAWSYHE